MIVCLLLFCSTSCRVRVKFRFSGDVSNVASIEIVEAVYDIKNDSFIQYRICTIEDVDSFLRKIELIKRKTYIFNDIVDCANNSMLAFKISYSDSYEFFDSAHRVKFT